MATEEAREIDKRGKQDRKAKLVDGETREGWKREKGEKEGMEIRAEKGNASEKGEREEWRRRDKEEMGTKREKK